MEIHSWISSLKALSKRQHFFSAHGWVSWTFRFGCVSIAIDTTNNNWLNFLNKWLMQTIFFHFEPHTQTQPTHWDDDGPIRFHSS